jgi:uncharacterized protein (TIGR02246 family)
MRAIVAISLALVAGACAGGPASKPAVDTKAEEQAIRQLDDQWNAALQKKDADAAASFYAPDAAAMWPDAPAINGTSAIHAAWVDFVKTPNLTGSFTPEEIKVSDSGDMASDVGKIHLEMDTPQGHQVLDGKYLVVWRKVNGMWKAQYDTFNSNMPAPPPASEKKK